MNKDLMYILANENWEDSFWDDVMDRHSFWFWHNAVKYNGRSYPTHYMAADCDTRRSH
jgi:hypothetical protein